MSNTIGITTFFTAGQGLCHSRHHTQKRQGYGAHTSQGRTRYSSPGAWATAHRRS